MKQEDHVSIDSSMNLTANKVDVFKMTGFSLTKINLSESSIPMILKSVTKSIIFDWIKFIDNDFEILLKSSRNVYELNLLNWVVDIYDYKISSEMKFQMNTLNLDNIKFESLFDYSQKVCLQKLIEVLKQTDLYNSLESFNISLLWSKKNEGISITKNNWSIF